MKSPKKFSGSSLVVTVVIALVLSVICSSLIMISYYNRQYDKKADIDARLIRNLESATTIVLSDTTIHTHSQTKKLDLFQLGLDSVIISQNNWGVLHSAHINAFYGRFSKSRTFLYGSSLPEAMNSCLYVPDRQRSVALIGKTRLVGNAYLSGAGLTTGYINQRGFEFDKLINGEIKRSAKQLPGLDGGLIAHLKDLLKACDNSVSTEKIPAYLNPDSLVVDFSDDRVLFFAEGATTIRNCKLSGRIMIFSNQLIEIDATARLQDIIIVAPSIRFKQGFRGRLQVIASDSLIIEDDCDFNYPSLIMLIKKDDETVQNKLGIGENCNINGVVISVCRNEDRNRSYVEIKKNTLINGIIYTMGYLDLKANVKGSVSTDFFVFRTPTTIYENYLVDVEIDRTKLSHYFLVPSIFKGSATKGIMQWLK